MPMTRSQWANSVALIEFEKVMRDEAIKNTWDWQQLYGDKQSTDEAEFKGYVWTAFGLPHERQFGEDIQTEKMQEVGSWTLSDVEIALGTDIDDKLLEDLRHISQRQFLNQMGEGFGESFSQAKCLYAAMPLNRAFSSAIQTMWDGVELCGTHPLLDGTSYVNKMTAGSPSFSRIWDMIDKLKIDQKTQKGLRKRGTAVLYICHDSHAREIEKIFRQKYEPDAFNLTGETNTEAVASLNENTLRNKGIKVLYCVELEDTDDHFLLGRKARRNFHFRMRKNLESHWEFGRRNRTRSQFSHMRLNVGVTDWEDVIGTPGS